MLTVNLYESLEEFCFFENKVEKKIIYICPGPLIADGVRSLLGKNAVVVTIAKWVNDQLKEKKQMRMMKSELLLRLSSIWRVYFPTSKEHLFFRAFEIFTDLRSFTLDQNLLPEVLGELDPDLKKSILLFWVYFENENIIDEQLAYKLASENKCSDSLCFIGFKHMNAIQIDMMKSLADRIDVSIAFPKEVYKETLATDWIRWLHSEVQKKYQQKEEQTTINIIRFPKNKLNLYLQEYRKNNSSFDVVIPSANMEISQYQEVLCSDLFFKTNIDLFAVEIELVISDLLKQKLTIDNLKSWLEVRKNDAIKNGNYRTLKVCSMIEESLTIFSEISLEIDNFFVSILKEVVLLNSPRNYLISLEEATKSKVLGLEEVRFEIATSPIAVIASTVYGKLSTSDRPYNDKIVNVLASIGPLKRAGLDFLFVKETLKKLLRQNKTVLFLEEGLIDDDLSWRDLLKDFNLNDNTVNIDYHLKSKRDIVKEKSRINKPSEVSLSASRLQTFLDCPRKYYFSYIEKISPRPEIRLAIDPDEKGNLEHKIIENYFSKYTVYNFESHSLICRSFLDDFLKDGKIKLGKQSQEETYFELLEFTKNGIITLLDYKIKFPTSSLSFEVAINDTILGLRGFVDCILKIGTEVHIFDFKRSISGIASKKELLNFEKIQLWIYKWALQQKYQIVWMGYLNLSDGALSGITSVEAGDNQIFNDFLIKLVDNFKSEEKFAPNPKNEKVCSFCELRLVCPKEEIS